MVDYIREYIHKTQEYLIAKVEQMKYAIKQLLNPLLVICLLIAKINYAADNTPNPILIIATDKNFGTFTGEILKTEGFNEFQIDSLTDTKMNLEYLKRFDLIILTEVSISTVQQEMFAKYVIGGGNLIAFKPDKKLSDVFGLIYEDETINEGYISIDPNSEIGNGLTTETLQIHATTDKCRLNKGKAIAALYKDAVTPTEYPIVVVNDYGKGHAMAFLYNLPRSIVYTRQGNFQYAGQEKDGIDGIRAMDMFTNGWVDTSKNILNQADEQMRLLSHGIEKMSSYTKPLPRFWYFPDALKCLVTLTNDGEDSKEADIDQQFKDVDSMRAIMTLYIKETDLISKDWVDKWGKKGFELAAHFDDTKQAQNPDWKTMDAVIKDLKKKMNMKYGISNIQTVTNHWFVWCGKDSNGINDFAAQAKLEASNGIGLDNNYARYDNKSNQGYFLGAMGTGQGNFTGSGLSIKFADNEGKVVNIYQHICNVYDQQYMEHDDAIGFYNCFKGLMDRSLNNEVYSYISIKAHTAEYFFSKTSLLKMLGYANEKHIPVWTVAKLLDFLKAKDEAGFTDINWKNNQLSFKIKSSLTHSNELSYMVPYIFNGKKINKITSNGLTQSYSESRIKGLEYAMITIKPGFNYTIEINYKN